MHAYKEEETLCKTGLGIKHLRKLSCFISIFPGIMMTIFLIECELLVKLFYENKENASTEIRKFHRKRNCGVDHYILKVPKT